MEIIDELEHSPRGVYCGSIGYLGYNRIADLNIAIRTLSYDGTQIRFGAGGAITYLSNPDQEFNEIMLKARALLQPIWSYLCGSNEPMNSTLSGRQLDIHSASEETRCIAH
jgi:para-aminobenzoate synthetase